ncbi:hypothetical protein PVIIG_05782 [Plasmodium vivax India VII]|uniref:Uncharacterized protein n=1 Tax=Plasmodium vivax India VII TaxID=1077284 RepID=A0A0J9S1M3_PLAVI|nr:hypothetical protein PVIIG_05782 [Plasmodium vivax India VII]
MADSTYNYVDEFLVWKKPLVDVEEKPDEPFIKACLPNITTDIKNYENYKKICLYFTKSMAYIVEDGNFKDNSNSLNGICAYLNYYLNSELRNINGSNEKPEEFYSKMRAKDPNNSLNLNKCVGKIKNIGDNHLDDMKFIHNLFVNVDNYINNYHDDNVKCPIAKACDTSYNERLNRCDKSSLDIFCQKMIEFKNHYETIMASTTCDVNKVLPEFGEKPTAGMKPDDAGDTKSSVDFSNLLRGKIGTLTLTTPGIVIGLSVLYKVIKIVRKKYDSFTKSW